MAAFSGFRVTDSGKLKFLISPDQRRGFSAFAAIGIPAALLSPLYPRSLDQSADEIGDDETGLQAAYDYQLQTEEGEPYRAVKLEARRSSSTPDEL